MVVGGRDRVRREQGPRPTRAARTRGASRCGSRARSPKIPTSSNGWPTPPNAPVDSTHALRLRFRAGLLRLGDRGAIRYRPSVTTNEVRRVLGSETFDELARTFEAVAYGGRDARAARPRHGAREWPRVVASAGKRSDR